MQLDVIVVGGSYAGMAAALQIARARRPVLVLDSGMRRNRFAESSHGFLGQDGRSPTDIAAEARAQLLAYPNVTFLDGTATQARKSDDGFIVETADRGTFHARCLVLATGIVDELLDLPGFQERWGRTVFHCPYCHGYELDNGRIGVLATGPWSMHQAMLIPDWGRTTLFTNGAFEPDEDELAQLAERGVAIERELVTEITGHADVRLRDGRLVPLDGLFTATRNKLASPLAEQLGCEIEESSLGPFIKTDLTHETTVPRVFACGDAARPSGSISLAVGDGAIAGVAAHRSLIFF